MLLQRTDEVDRRCDKIYLQPLNSTVSPLNYQEAAP
jgi:hypothetical protein